MASDETMDGNVKAFDIYFDKLRSKGYDGGDGTMNAAAILVLVDSVDFLEEGLGQSLRDGITIFSSD